MVKIAKITNRAGKKFMVPIFKAKSMMVNDEIEDYEVIEVEHTKNMDKPQTQKDFERALTGVGIGSQELQSQNEQLIKALLEAQEMLKKYNQPTKSIADKQTTVNTPTPEPIKVEENNINDKYKEIYGKEVPNNKKNDAEWIESKINNAAVEGEIKVPTL